MGQLPLVERFHFDCLVLFQLFRYKCLCNLDVDLKISSKPVIHFPKKSNASFSARTEVAMKQASGDGRGTFFSFFATLDFFQAGMENGDPVDALNFNFQKSQPV